MINILFTILISICLIKSYFNISLIFTIIFGFFKIRIRVHYFNSVQDWPSYHPIVVIIMMNIAVIYLKTMGEEFISNYIKYIIFYKCSYGICFSIFSH